MDCPACGAAGLQSVEGIWRCDWCGQVGDGLPDAPSTAPRPPALHAAPSQVRARVHDSGLELRLPWRHDIGLGAMVLHALLTLGTTSIAIASLLRGAPTGLVPLGIGLGLGFLFLRSLVNETTVLISPRAVEITHGPMPSLMPTRVLQMADLGSLRVQQRVTRARNSRKKIRWYLVTDRTEALREWQRQETLQYVRDAIRYVGGFPDERLL